MLYQLLLSTRPRQWVKSLVVLAALVFSRHLLQLDYALAALAATAVFVLLSAAIYLLNDVADREQDRRHPVKSQRPIASGRLPVSIALVAAVTLLAAGLAWSWALQPRFAAVGGVYVALNFAYSIGFKRAVLIDILMVAAGFLLRAVGGAVVIEVDISPWFVLCTFTLTLFLAAAKRRGELLRLEGEAGQHRQALDAYEVGYLDQVLGVLASATIVCYALYAMGVGELGVTAHRQMQWTIPFVLYGVLRYLYLVHQQGDGEDPTAVLWRDRPLQLNLALWGVASLVLVYWM